MGRHVRGRDCGWLLLSYSLGSCPELELPHAALACSGSSIGSYTGAAEEEPQRADPELDSEAEEAVQQMQQAREGSLHSHDITLRFASRDVLLHCDVCVPRIQIYLL